MKNEWGPCKPEAWSRLSKKEEIVKSEQKRNLKADDSDDEWVTT